MSKVVAYRFDQEFLDKIEEYREKRSEELGFKLSATDAVRSLIKQGFQCAEEKEKAEV